MDREEYTKAYEVIRDKFITEVERRGIYSSVEPQIHYETLTKEKVLEVAEKIRNIKWS
jgi:hypothetical protein